MLKNILSLEGAQELTKNQLKSIAGGKMTCLREGVIIPCPDGQCCGSDRICYLCIEFPG